MAFLLSKILALLNSWVVTLVGRSTDIKASDKWVLRKYGKIKYLKI